MPLPRKRTDLEVAIAKAVRDFGLSVVRQERNGAWGLRVSVKYPGDDGQYDIIAVGPLMEDTFDRDKIDDALYDAFVEKLHAMERPPETVELIESTWSIVTNRSIYHDSDRTKDPLKLSELLERVRARINEHLPVHGEAPKITRCDAERRVRNLQARYETALRHRLPTSASYIARRLMHLHEYHASLHPDPECMPWTASWLAEQALAALDEQMEEEKRVLVGVTNDQALALRNVILPRLVDLEQHGYSEEYDGEGKDLRSIGDVLEHVINRGAMKDRLG